MERTESGRGLLVFSLITGLFVLCIVMLFTAVRFNTMHHGNEFTLLSEGPFNFEQSNDLRFRILSPLLGYLLFFRGALFKYFMLIVLALFLGMIYYYFRKKGLRPTESTGMQLILAFSTLTFYQLYFPAYTDPTTFLLTLLFMMVFRRPVLSTLLLSLLLFNHEHSIFLFPFFFLLMVDGNYRFGNLFRIVMRMIISLLPYLAYRYFIMKHQAVDYTLAYYFNDSSLAWTREHVLPNLASGVFQSFRLAWILPLMAIIIDLKEKRYNEILLLISVLFFVMLQFFIAYDISRLAGLCFPAIVLSAIRLKNYLGMNKLLYLLYGIFILNFLIPSYCIGALEPISYLPFWLR